MTPRTESRFDCLIALAFWFVGAILVLSNNRLEGHAWTWPAFRDRFRLGRLTGQGWLLTVILCLVTAPFVGGVLIERVANLFVGVHLYDPPQGFSSFMGSLVSGGNQFLGIPLQGNWGFLGYYLVFLFVAKITHVNLEMRARSTISDPKL